VTAFQKVVLCMTNVCVCVRACVRVTVFSVLETAVSTVQTLCWYITVVCTGML